MPLFDGLPLHPLVVHAPVVLIPLIAGGLLLLLVRPRLRRPLAPLLALLAIAAAASTLGAVWSGEHLGEALSRGDELDRHETWGELTRALTVALALGTGAYAVLTRLPAASQPVATAFGVVTTGLAVAAVAAVGVTGHAGARLAWEGRLIDDDLAAARLPVAAPRPAPAGTPAAAPASPASPAAPAAAVAGGSEIDVVLGEWALVPSTQVVAPGTVTVRFRNAGTMGHALRIRSDGSGSHRREWRSEVIPPGSSGLLVVDLAAGTYEVDCPVEDAFGEHDALGMETRLFVRGDAQQAPAVQAPAVQTPGVQPPGVQPPGVQPPEQTIPAPSTPTSVGISRFAYSPATVRVPVGGRVVWANRDPAAHTATAEADGSTGSGFDTGPLAPGATGTVTFTTPGTYDYRCTLHPAMRGRVLVTP